MPKRLGADARSSWLILPGTNHLSTKHHEYVLREKAKPRIPLTSLNVSRSPREPKTVRKTSRSFSLRINPSALGVTYAVKILIHQEILLHPATLPRTHTSLACFFATTESISKHRFWHHRPCPGYQLACCCCCDEHHQRVLHLTTTPQVEDLNPHFLHNGFLHPSDLLPAERCCRQQYRASNRHHTLLALHQTSSHCTQRP